MKLSRVLEFTPNRPPKGADDSYEGFSLGGIICTCPPLQESSNDNWDAVLSARSAGLR